MTISRKASAKLNLFLHIIGRRNDSYHLLQSLFVKLSLSDTIQVESSDKLSCDVIYNFSLNQKIIEDNIVLKAAQKLLAYINIQGRAIFHYGAHITIYKNIPIASGLGGGSSNAAATLQLLNEFWNLKLNEEALMNIALNIGADVPFCLSESKCSFIEGIGEKLKPFELNKKLYLVLVNPNFSIKKQ